MSVFAPRGRFTELASDHLPFDVLTATDRHEALALSTIVLDTRGIFVVGPRGGGKSSMVAYVCAHLPETHIALRVPVTGADAPSSVSAVAAIALSTALSTLKLEGYQREALENARADEVVSGRRPPKVGGKLGGGPMPAELVAELGSLDQELTTARLSTERLAGLDRLITILVARGLAPVFVMEDTEAIVGTRHPSLP